jgi:hypothetical protein
MSGIRDLLNLKGITPQDYEMRSTTLFDTVSLLAAAETPLFVGLTGRSGNKALTNIEQPNSLPDPDNFAISGLSIILGANGAVADVNKILDTSVVRIDLSGRTIFEGPLSSIAFQGNGTVGMREMYDLDYPQLAKPAARITGYILTTVAAAAAVSTQVILHGTRITKR